MIRKGSANRRGFKVRRLIGTALLSAVIVAGLGSGAEASVTLTNGASASTQITCSQSMQWVRRTVTMNPQRGFSSQYASWRSYVYNLDTGGGFWTSWTTEVARFSNVYVANLGGANLKFYMQYSWWDGRAWSSPVGEWINTYTQTAGSSQWQMNYCAV